MSATAVWPVYRRMLSYARPHLGRYLIGVLGMVLFAASNASVAWFVKELGDAAAGGAALSDGQRLLKWIPLGIVGIFLVRGIGDYLGNYFPGWVGRAVIRRMREQLYAHYLRLPTAYYDRESTAPMLTRLAYNIELVAEATTNSLTVIIRESLNILLLLVSAFLISWKLALYTLIIAPIIVGLVRGVNRRFRRYSQRIQDSLGDVTRVVKETLDANRVVKVFNAEAHLDRRFGEANEHNRVSNLKLIRAKASSNPVVQLIAALGLAGVLYVASNQVLRGEAAIGEVVGFLAALLMISHPLRLLVGVAGPFQQGVTAGASVFTVLDEPTERDSGTRAFERARGAVEFRDVGFGYQSSPDQVLRNIQLAVEPGATIAIVGRSGSGKSTLVSLLPRFYDVSSGAVLIDGVDVRDYRLSALRAQMSLVSQEVIIFNDTIRNNILFGAENAAADAVEAAAEAAHVSEFAARMSGGLDAVVGDRGVLLSGGQRQRIAIARALLRNTPILILDEATSALDTASERHIQAALDELLRNRTTFVIAHRLSTIEHADLIVVMEGGAIVERGTHAELLTRRGVYAQLHALQFNA